MTRQIRDAALLLFGLCGAIAILWILERPAAVQTKESIDPRVVTGSYSHHPLHRVTVYNEEKSWPGVLLVPVYDIEQVLLLGPSGKLLHYWPIDTERSRLLPNCNLLTLHGTKIGAKREPWSTLQYSAREYDWEWNIAWEHVSDDILHHDISRLPGEKTLLLQRTKRPNKGIKFDGKPRQLRADLINIIDRSGSSQWLWSSFDAFDHSYCGVRSCELAEVDRDPTMGLKRRIDWTHGNTVRRIPENKWYPDHPEFKPGNILFYPRNFWEMYIIDRDSKEIVWTFPSDKQREDPELKIFGGHEPHMIGPDLPGAGNLLIFDNGHLIRRPYSRVLEIDPVNGEVVWSYVDKDRFFSRVAGSIQRLPNGNTLISQDVRARVFEVTPQGEIVWEAFFPDRTARAHKYSLDHCARAKDIIVSSSSSSSSS